jgi:3-(3-hydroxy-phenyl)propionate hydroxylase
LERYDSPVGIVGAGPVGLTLAARLASFGIPVVLLESNPGLQKRGSRACLIQGDVLEVLDRIGCAEQIRDEGVTWRVSHTYVRNKEVRVDVYPARIGFGPFVNISQYRIEQVLLSRVESDPRCDVRWSHRVVMVSQDSGGVQVEVETANGHAEMRFLYLVACDGIHSALRDLLGVNWTGYSHKDRFLITDIRARLSLPKERHFHYDPSFNPGRQVVIHPQPDDMWRIDWQLAPEADIDDERQSSAFDRRVHAVIGDIPYEVDWLSTYRFHQRVIEQFIVGRVFFAGDAAHALPPYGARGMNSGIQDADNLAWKLALVLHGQSAEGLLDTYHIERYAAARENLAVTEATIHFMVPPTLMERLKRSLLLQLAKWMKSSRKYVNSGRMAEPSVYTESPIIDCAYWHPLVGRLAPDGWVLTGGRRARIRKFFGEQFIVLYFAENANAAQKFINRALTLATVLPVGLVVVLPAGTEKVESYKQVIVAYSEGPTLRVDYSIERPQVMLIRPDGHVAAAFDAEIDAPGILTALKHCALLVHGEDDCTEQEPTLVSN